MSGIDYKHLLQRADILLVYNKRSLLHKLICKITRRESSEYKAGHVALYLFDDLMTEASAFGIRNKKLKSYDVNKHALYIARHVGIDETIQKKIINSAITKAGNRYAFLQLPLILFKYLFKLNNIPDVSRKAMICSEFVASEYAGAGAPLFTKDSEEVTTNDYFSCDKLGITKVN